MGAPTKSPLLPKVTLYKNDASTYVFDPFTPTLNYRIRSLFFDPPTDAKGGEFDMVITSNDATNASTNTLLANFEEGNEVLIALGKATPTNVFLGVIESVDIKMRNLNYMDIVLHGPDWGSDILKHRVVNGTWTQAKTADGVTLDTSDTNVLIEQIAKDLLQDSSKYAAPNVAAEDQGIVVSAGNFVSTNIKLAQFYAQYEKLDDKLTELDEVAGTIHYVDSAKNYIQKYPGDNLGAPATFLLTDDAENDSVAAAWDPTKLGYWSPDVSVKRSIEHHNRQFFGLGGDLVQIDQKQETDSSSDPTFTGGAVQWLACRMLPTTASANIEKIGIKISKQGSPTEPLVMTIIEDNQGATTNSKPLGQTLIRTSKPASALPSSAEWRYFPVVQPISAKSLYWIVLEGNGDASNYYKWHKDAGTSYATSISTNGTSWTTTTGTTGNCFRQYYATPLLSIFPGSGVLATDKHLHEIVIKRPDITESQHMLALLVQTAKNGRKRKETISGKVYAPDNLLQTGQAIRSRIQQAGYVVDGEYIIGRLPYRFESSDDMSTGMYYYDIEAARYITY